jgi:hypothetical protein
MAFWGFIATVVVAGIWYDLCQREAQQETICRLFESGRELDGPLIDRLLEQVDDKAGRLDRALKLSGVVLVPAAVGLAILGVVLGLQVPEARLPLLGAACLIGHVGKVCNGLLSGLPGTFPGQPGPAGIDKSLAEHPPVEEGQRLQKILSAYEDREEQP